MKLYLIPGLGADGRVFEDLSPGSTAMHIIEWLPPHRSETINEYAKRLSEQIDDQEDFALLGVSFGGIVAQEIARIKAPSGLFLISTVESEREYSFQLRALGRMRAYKLISGRLMRSVGGISASRYFSIKDAENKALLKNIMHSTDPDFLEWAVRVIMHWKSEESPLKAIRIHGKTDKIFPAKNLRSSELHLLDGGHFIIKEQAKMISDIISKNL